MNRPHQLIGLRDDDSERIDPFTVRLAPYVPQSRKGERLLSFEMDPHGHLVPSLLAPLIETVSGDNTAASIHERLEGRQLCERFGAGVDHSVADRRVCGPMRNQSPVHEPALVTAHVADNHGNRRGNLLGGNIKARCVARQIAVKIPADRMSLNSNVAVNRPHTLKAPLRCTWGGISVQRCVARFGSVQYPGCNTSTP